MIPTTDEFKIKVICSEIGNDIAILRDMGFTKEEVMEGLKLEVGSLFYKDEDGNFKVK